MAEELDPLASDELAETAGADNESATQENPVAKDSATPSGSPAKPVTKARAGAPVKKAKPAPKTGNKKSEPADPYKANNPVHFTKQSIAELKKVVWPTKENTWGYFVLVLAFVLFLMTFVSLLDMGFGWGLLKIFG